jgi:rhodanese-related sulfurtransferase
MKWLYLLAALLLLVPLVVSGQDSFEDAGRMPPPSTAGSTLGTPPRDSPAPVAPQPGQAQSTAQTDLTAVAAMESRDFGIAAVDQLHSGAMHGPTPTRIPGGQVVGTLALRDTLQGQKETILLFDVLGAEAGLPGAQNALGAAQAGSFNDEVQSQFGQYLQQATSGRKDMPLVFYCLSVECWMSYNASLRAIHLGYTRVLWYRGGIEAWQAAGLPVYPRR